MRRAILLSSLLALSCAGPRLWWNYTLARPTPSVTVLAPTDFLPLGCVALGEVNEKDGRASHDRRLASDGTTERAINRLIARAAMRGANVVVVQEDVGERMITHGFGGEVIVFGNAYRCRR